MLDGYELSIRTPVTPPRWQDFDEVRACQSRSHTESYLAAFQATSLLVCEVPHRRRPAGRTRRLLACGTRSCRFTLVFNLLATAPRAVSFSAPRLQQLTGVQLERFHNMLLLCLCFLDCSRLLSARLRGQRLTSSRRRFSYSD